MNRDIFLLYANFLTSVKAVRSVKTAGRSYILYAYAINYYIMK